MDLQIRPKRPARVARGTLPDTDLVRRVADVPYARNDFGADFALFFTR
jgi:hypothetical protein